MTDRWTFGETVTIIAKLPDNALNVTVSVWKVNGTPVVVNQPCQQIIISIFMYRFQPTDASDYIWQMKGTHPQTGKLHTVEDSFSYGGWVDSLLKPEHLNLIAKEETVLTRATPADIKDFTLTRILTAPRNLELIAKSVSHYYRGQIGTTVVMARYAGAPTDVTLFASYYYPDNTPWMENEEMTPVGETGLYAHNFLIPKDAPEGVYKVKFKATKNVDAQQLVDTFTESDGPPTNWIIFGGTWNVASNICKQTASSYAYLHWKDPLAVEWSDYSLEVEIRADNDLSNNLFGLMARYMSRSKTYAFYYGKYRNKLCLDKGTSSIMEKDKSLVYNQWYKFKMEFIGPIVKCYLDDQLEFEWTDLDPLRTGVPTLYCANPHSFDNVIITIPAQEYQEFEVTDFQIDDTIKTPIDLIKKIESNKWAIANDQLIIYDDDQITPLLTFNLTGNSQKAYSERTPTS